MKRPADINFVNNELPAPTRKLCVLLPPPRPLPFHIPRSRSSVRFAPRRATASYALSLLRGREEGREGLRIVTHGRRSSAYLGRVAKIFRRDARQGEAERTCKTIAIRRYFLAPLCGRGPVKGGPNFEIHCAPLCAAALISAAWRERGVRYDALKMDKTGRLNIRRAVVQKFTSAAKEGERKGGGRERKEGGGGGSELYRRARMYTHAHRYVPEKGRERVRHGN